MVKPLVGSRQSIIVQGTGRVEQDGTVVLDQTVQREGKAPVRRQWRIRDVGEGRYTGTLTDAIGPVTGSARGNRLELRYRLKEGGLDAKQVLHLQPDGRTVLNWMKLSKLGLQVATVEETIRKLD